jgi:hypothetical protein
VSTNDRRHEPRIHSMNLVNVAQFDPDGFFAELGMGRTLDLSRGGLRLELTQPLPLRTLVSLSLVLDGSVADVEGEVVYLEVLDEARCAMGIRFTEVSSGTQTILDRHIEEHAG